MDRNHFSQASSRNMARLRRSFQALLVGLHSPDSKVVGSTMASENIRSQTFKQVVLRPPDPPPDLPKPPVYDNLVRPSRSELIRRRFEAMRMRSTAKNPVCFKCGDRGHRAVECRNAWLCLVCKQHGHQSKRCSGAQIVSSPSLKKPTEPSSFVSSAPAMAKVRNPILMFNPTPDSKILLQNFQKSFILSDVANWGVDKVENTITKVFANIPWRVSIFDDNKYLIQAPTLAWQQSMTRTGVLRLDGVKFPVVPWEAKYSEGKKLTSLWVKIHGYPHLLWQWQEVDRMLNPLGAVLLEMDPGAGQKCNWKFVRVRIGICERDLLPTKHWMMARDVAGYVSGFDLYFEVEGERAGLSKGPKGGIKKTGGGARNGPPIAPPPPPPSADSSSEMPDAGTNVPGKKDEKGKGKLEGTGSGCQSDDMDLLGDDDDTSDEDNGLLSHYNQVYGGMQTAGGGGSQVPPAAHNTTPANNTDHPKDSDEEPLLQRAARLTWGSQSVDRFSKRRHKSIPVYGPRTPGVRYKVTVKKLAGLASVRSSSAGASPQRGRSLVRSGRKTYSRDHEDSPSGATGSRQGLHNTQPRRPSPTRPPSPIGVSAAKPIVLMDSSSE